MASGAATRRRSGTATVSLGTVGAIAALKPRPPSSPRSSLLGDITNGASGLLSGAGKGSADAEVARLSSKILDLMSQLHTKDDQLRKLESALELARKEAANATALLRSGAPAAAPAAAPADAPPSSRARVPAPRPVTSSSPTRNVMVKVLSAALQDADQVTAMKTEELAAARAMLAHRTQMSNGAASADGPAPGVVARLQAELAEAAEERRSLRQQLQGLRERLKEVQQQLVERSSQLTETERARRELEAKLGASSNADDAARMLAAELRQAQAAVANADARALELQRRLDVSIAKQQELQSQVAHLQQQLQAANANASAADEACELRSRLQAALEQLGRSRKETEAEARAAREATERSERAEGLARESGAELQRAKAAATRANQHAGAEKSAELLRLQGELREANRLAAMSAEQAEAAAAQAAQAAQSKLREELNAAREAARRMERELRAQIASLEGELADAVRRAEERELSARAAQERAEELARQLAAAEAAKDEAEARGNVAANAARSDAGRAANELRYALRGKEKELTDMSSLLAKLRGSAAADAAAAAKNGKMETREAEARAEKMAAELVTIRQCSNREANARIAKLTAELEGARSEAAAAASRQRSSTASGGASDDLRRQAEREAAERKAAEARLLEVRERLEKQQKRHEEQVAQLRGQKPAAAPAAVPPAPTRPASKSGESDEELRRKLAAALEELAAVKDEFEKKKEAWRISSLKRHAEANKLEQALKVSSTNEALLKKKADMLELTLLSQQKSMDKGRVSIVREQLKEHNERLEQQGGIKDLHANATTRKTFDETYTRQMDALDGKLRKLH